MLIEIIGAKILTPYLGSSHFVWMSQILTTLIALSVGSFFSHKIKNNRYTLAEFKILLIPAVYILIANKFNREIVLSFLHLPLSAMSVISSIFLFFVPLSIISFSYSLMVTKRIDKLGSNEYGKISAIGTVGSVFGACFFGYFLVELFSNDEIFLMSSILLFICSFTPVFFARQNYSYYYIYPITMIILNLTHWGSLNPDRSTLLLNKNSKFGELTAVDEGDKIVIYSNNLRQNSFFKKDKTSADLFTHALTELSYKYTPVKSSALVIGAGLGFVSNDLLKIGFKNVKSIEINNDIFEMGRHFGLYDDNLEIEFYDGRYYLSKTKEMFDLIVVDAFVVDNSPSHLNTIEFFSILKSKLKSGGILVMNTFGFTEPAALITKSTIKTVSTVFRDTDVYSLNEGNVFFVSGDDLVISDKSTKLPIHDEVKNKLNLLLSNKKNVELNEGIIFYDSSNKIDYLNSDLRETIRKSMALKLKK